MACSILTDTWIINHIEFSRVPQLILKQLQTYEALPAQGRLFLSRTKHLRFYRKTTVAIPVSKYIH